MQYIKKKTYLLLALLMAFSGLAVLLPQTASAAQLTARKLTLSSSSNASSNATTSYTFDFTTATTATIASFKAQICTTASGTCTIPTGFDEASSTLTSTTFSGTWSVSTATNGELRASASGASSTNSGVAKQFVFGAVQNPTTDNTTFYARLTTYTGTDWSTGSTDTGVVAASTASQISLSGTMDESLVFCSATTITGTDCGTATGSSVSFGTFSSTATSTGTSLLVASTNGQSGYAISVNGATLTSGSNTVTALSSATASSTGSSQFGLNLRDNATPNIGADPSGASGTSYGTGYGTADQFKFVTGETIASRSNVGDATKFTVSYIVNVGGSQAAGTYTATMTYICTATF